MVGRFSNAMAVLRMHQAKRVVRRVHGTLRGVDRQRSADRLPDCSSCGAHTGQEGHAPSTHVASGIWVASVCSKWRCGECTCIGRARCGGAGSCISWVLAGRRVRQQRPKCNAHS